MKNAVKVFSVLTPLIAVIIWQVALKSINVYLMSAVVLLMSMVPFFWGFSAHPPNARELSLMGAVIALAVVSRGVFYLVPQVKPIAAVVIVGAVCLGGSRGYIIGAFSAFVSNFIFGQGVWTPFQMVGLGLCGLFAGWIFDKLRANRVTLAVYGFFAAGLMYGLIVDTSTVLMTVSEFSIPAVAAVYLAGLPFDLVFGVSTAVFLLIFGTPFVNKIERLIQKYDIIKIDKKENCNE